MNSTSSESNQPSLWKSLDGTMQEIVAHAQTDDRGSLPNPNLLAELASGAIPAIVIRNSISSSECQSVTDRLLECGQLFDPTEPIPQSFIERSIPEGYFQKGDEAAPKYAWQTKDSLSRVRIDIGTSLGYRGRNKEEFLTQSQSTHQLFGEMFGGRSNPVDVIYNHLQQLTERRVVTACEPDGRKYGPAIFRAHYGGYTYQPHFDSVRLREKRTEYSVYQFEHQFAGVLVLQNSSTDADSPHTWLHRYLWQPEIDEHLGKGTFHQFAKENHIEKVEIRLNPGDLYFFNTRHIHEVPGVEGALPRIVLATFIGFSDDLEEVFVWS